MLLIKKIEIQLIVCNYGVMVFANRPVSFFIFLAAFFSFGVSNACFFTSLFDFLFLLIMFSFVMEGEFSSGTSTAALNVTQCVSRQALLHPV